MRSDEASRVHHASRRRGGGWPLAAGAQQATMPVIGFLCGALEPPLRARLRAFHGALKETGYVEGENTAIVYRLARGSVDRLPALAADLFAGRSPGSPRWIGRGLTAKRQRRRSLSFSAPPRTRSRSVLSPALTARAATLTGVNFFVGDLGAKQLGLLHELVPAIARVACSSTRILRERSPT